MSGLTLDRSEFLVLMDAVKAPAVMGLDTQALVPADKEQHKALVLAGLEKLKARGLMRVEGDVHVLDPGLLAVAMAVGHPDVVVITRKDTPGLGSQLFLHYVAGPAIVEQTLPDEHQHRLAALPDRPTLIERLAAILPVPDSQTMPDERGVLAQDAFLEVKRQAENGAAPAAKATLTRAGLSAAGAESVVQAMAHPVLGGTIALLEIEGTEATDARNLALVTGQDAAWLIRQTEPGAPNFEVRATDGLALRTVLVRWLQELEN